MRKKINYIDANIILRYLLQDHETLFKKSQKLIESENTFFILNEVLAEVVYVLHKTYSINRKIVADILTSFILFPNMQLQSKETMSSALQVFAQTKLDFIDCILCAVADNNENKIITFDKKLNNYIKSRKEK